MPERSGAVRLEGEYKEALGRLRTLRDLLRFGVSRFNQAQLAYGHGTDNALDEAHYLVCHALHLSPEQAEAFLDARLTRSEIRAAIELLWARVRERRPAAYLTHEAWIGPHRFYVDERAIVPRSYIGHWLLSDLSPWIAEPERVTRVLELCTGSGCLAVLAAMTFEQAHIDAVDVSSEALEVAHRNVADYGLAERIRLIHGDLYEALERRRYDVILANPPYVRSAAMAELPPEYRHEPALALAGGEDGLEIVRRIVSGARTHLAPRGVLIMEVGHARPAVEAAYPRTGFTWLEIDGADDAVFVLSRSQLPPARAIG